MPSRRLPDSPLPAMSVTVPPRLRLTSRPVEHGKQFDARPLFALADRASRRRCCFWLRSCRIPFWPKIGASFADPRGKAIPRPSACRLIGPKPKTFAGKRRLPAKAGPPRSPSATSIFLTTAVPTKGTHSLHALCLDAKTGKIVWDVTVFDSLVPEHRKADSCEELARQPHSDHRRGACVRPLRRPWDGLPDDRRQNRVEDARDQVSATARQR